MKKLIIGLAVLALFTQLLLKGVDNLEQQSLSLHHKSHIELVKLGE